MPFFIPADSSLSLPRFKTVPLTLPRSYHTTKSKWFYLFMLHTLTITSVVARHERAFALCICSVSKDIRVFSVLEIRTLKQSGCLQHYIKGKHVKTSLVASLWFFYLGQRRMSQILLLREVLTVLLHGRKCEEGKRCWLSVIAPEMMNVQVGGVSVRIVNPSVSKFELLNSPQKIANICLESTCIKGKLPIFKQIFYDIVGI